MAFTVCEGLFDTAPAIMNARFPHYLVRFLEWILPNVTEHDIFHRATPLWAAENFINTNHPVLIVSSLVDQVVPHAHTKRVFETLLLRAPKTEFLTLDESPHSSYATWTDKDRQKYVAKVQSWVNQYI